MRYYLHDGAAAFRLKLYGNLSGQDVTEVEQCWRTAESTIAGRRFVVELSDVTAVDEAGAALLLLWSRHGAQFLATSAQARLLVHPIVGDALIQAATDRPASNPRFPWRLGALAAAVLVSLVLPATVSAAEECVPSPGVVLARYSAAIERNDSRAEPGAVVLDIEASLPKLAKKGRLQAIRRLVPFARPEYQVLQFEGDGVVRQQVIARYLSADAQARQLPPSAVAVSAANYKFRFIGPIGTGRTLTYVFRITPKKKRLGLIQGELWIDTATGLVVRQAGYLVKRPSMFVRRIDVTQDTEIREGSPYLRITRLGIETRLAGRAELTIKEHPGRSASIPENN
jgi:ABC-type transporter Mla MlaB component